MQSIGEKTTSNHRIEFRTVQKSYQQNDQKNQIRYFSMQIPHRCIPQPKTRNKLRYESMYCEKKQKKM